MAKKIKGSVRKITKVGGKSFCVTIPIEVIKKLRWRERQKVVVTLSGKKVIIQDYR